MPKPSGSLNPHSPSAPKPEQLVVPRILAASRFECTLKTGLHGMALFAILTQLCLYSLHRLHFAPTVVSCQGHKLFQQELISPRLGIAATIGVGARFVLSYEHLSFTARQGSPPERPCVRLIFQGHRSGEPDVKTFISFSSRV